jgi:hypothetical protein
MKIRNKETIILDNLLSLDNPKGLNKFIAINGPRITNLIFNSLNNLNFFNNVWRKFVAYLVRLNREHGTLYVIKYMKASHVAIQRFLSGSPVTALQQIEAGYPFPRIIKGLPSIIPKEHRDNFSPDIARFWLTLFGMYRIIHCPFKPKLSTITNPYTGTADLRSALSIIINGQPQGFYPYFVDLLRSTHGARPRIRDLKINQFFVSWTSSPSCKYSWMGLFKDRNLILSSGVEPLFLSWISETKSTAFFEFTRFGSSFHDWYQKIIQGSSYPRGQIIGKLAFKEEAAGKLRIFALVDSITQTLLQPLHKSLFSILRLIPNDGTFDQNASYWRAVQKMSNSGNAFSFDLSAATDRLPIVIQEQLLAELYSPIIGETWSKLLIERDYQIPENQYGLTPGPIRYAVGQPMGALSSWAMLAMTHHLIVQFCWYQLGNRSWTTAYEVLGDDIVIFDKDLAWSYHKFMTINLGVEVNLSKSLVSEAGSALEFAKRTNYSGHDVSGIPLKGFLSKYSYPAAASLLLKLVDSKLLTNKRLLAISLPSTSLFKSKFDSRFKIIGKMVISLLASLVMNHRLSLRQYLLIILNPAVVRIRLKDQPNKISNWAGIPVVKIMDALVSHYCDQPQGLALDSRIKIQPIYYSYLFGIEQQLGRALNKAYDQQFQAWRALRSDLASIWGHVVLGYLPHDRTLPSWIDLKGLNPLPYPTFIKERYGNIDTILGLLIACGPAFARSMSELNSTRMHIKGLNDLHSNIFMIPRSNYFSCLDERRLSQSTNPDQIIWYEDVNDIGFSSLVNELHSSLMSNWNYIGLIARGTLVPTLSSDNAIFDFLTILNKIENESIAMSSIMSDQPVVEAELSRKLDNFTLNRLGSIRNSLLRMQR